MRPKFIMKEHSGFNRTVPGCEAGNKTLSFFEFYVDLPDAGLVQKEVSPQVGIAAQRVTLFLSK